VSSDQIAALGAFFSGVGSVISAAWFIRRQRRRAEADCDKRVAEFERALHEGVEIAREHEKD